MLGGDAEIEFTYRFADAGGARLDGRERRARSPRSSTSARMAAPRAGAEPERTLVQVKAVDGALPALRHASPSPAAASSADALGAAGRPARARRRAGADRPARPRARRRRPPRRPRTSASPTRSSPSPTAASGFGFGPRVIVRRADLAASGLLAEGSLFDSSYRLRLAPDADLGALERRGRARASATPGCSGATGATARPASAASSTGSASFLVLIGLAGLAVGGVGVAAAVRAHLEAQDRDHRHAEDARRHRRHGLRDLSDRRSACSRSSASPSASSSAPRCRSLAAPLVAEPPAGAGRVRPLLRARWPRRRSTARLTALIFTLWPLARARDIRAAELFRDLTAARRGWPRPRLRRRDRRRSPRRSSRVATRLSGAPELALGTAGGVAGALARRCSLAARGPAARSPAGSARGRLVRGRPALRWALAALGGPSGETASVVLVARPRPQRARRHRPDRLEPAQPDHPRPARARAGLLLRRHPERPARRASSRAAEARAGRRPTVETAPMLRGIITRINGRPAREVAGPHWALSGDRGVTYAARPPAGTVITEGAWWPEDYAGPPLMSFAAEEGRELGLKLGDTLTVNILGRDLTATIASFREVRFETMGINFLIMLDPGGARRRAAHPHRHRLCRARRPRRRCCAPSPTPIRTSPRSACARRSTGSPTALDGHRRRHPLGARRPRCSPASSC